MTAIAGATGAVPVAQLQDLVLKSIEQQRSFGSAVSFLEAVDGAVAAVSPNDESGASSIVVDGPYLLAADLRLDNRDELRERVNAAHNDLSDAELLLRSWQKAGEKCLDWLVGDFAFALFDSREKALYLARDVTGHRALHYARTGFGTAFASMPSGLGPAVGGLEPNRSTLAKFAIQVSNTTEQSCFEGILRVRPGEVVRIDRDGADRARYYWQPDCTPRGPVGRAEIVEEYRHLLDEAVSARIAGCSRPIASMLSSGFDSSSVTATAARLLKAPDSLVAFTSVPTMDASVPASLRRFADESPIAAQTAAMHGIRHVIVGKTPSVLDVIRQQIPVLQLPPTSVINLAWWEQIRIEASAIGATCLLTGESGNHSMNVGGVYYLSEFLRRRQWGTWLGQAIAAARAPDTRFRGVLFNSLEPWMPTSVWRWLRRTFLQVRSYSEVTFLRHEWQKEAETSVTFGDSPGRNLYADRLTMLRVFDFGEFRKAALAGHGINELDPMSDRRLLEFGLRIPPEHLYWNGVSRPLMRDALADRLPRIMFETKGRGLQGADWGARFTRSDALSIFEEVSASRIAGELFDLQRMREAIERWPSRDWNEPALLQEYPNALIPALAVGLFAKAYERV